MMLRINDYPQLRFLAWNRPNAEFIEEAEAFDLYERHWDVVDQDALTEAEQALIERLTREVGGGVLLAA